MPLHKNPFGQPVGYPMPSWQPSPIPPKTTIVGQSCRIEPLNPQKHAAELHAAYSLDEVADLRWTYLTYGPFETEADFTNWTESLLQQDHTHFQVVVDSKTERAVGMTSYLRINPQHGSIEVGHINYSTLLQNSLASTESNFLLMKRAFDELGYRRYEWKCDSLNAPSRAAALRLGFTYEGLFRNAIHYRDRNRDTTWFSITLQEWPSIKAAFEEWLNPANFDHAGKQRVSLSTFTQQAKAGFPPNPDLPPQP